MNLPDAPIALEGFFATHFFTVKDQDNLRPRCGKVSTIKRHISS